MFVACDVTRDADLQRLIDQTLARFGQIDGENFYSLAGRVHQTRKMR